MIKLEDGSGRLMTEEGYLLLESPAFRARIWQAVEAELPADDALHARVRAALTGALDECVNAATQARRGNGDAKRNRAIAIWRELGLPRNRAAKIVAERLESEGYGHTTETTVRRKYLQGVD